MIFPTYQLKFLIHCDFVACCSLIIGHPIDRWAPLAKYWAPRIDAPAYNGRHSSSLLLFVAKIHDRMHPLA